MQRVLQGEPASRGGPMVDIYHVSPHEFVTEV